MTVDVSKKRKMAVHGVLQWITLGILFPVILIHGSGLGDAVTDGAKLALTVVLPSVFPFMVLSDMLSALPWRPGRVAIRISRLFGIPEAALGAVICGNILGFPLGARYVARILGDSDENLTVRCAAVATNPSAAFVISGVGAGMLGDVKIGILLYAILIASTAVTAMAFRENRNLSLFSYDNTEQKFSLASSIASAGSASVSVLASISFFSGVSFLVRKMLGKYVAFFISPLLEVSCAVSMLATQELPSVVRLGLISFALGFSGVCAAVQCAPYFSRGARIKNMLIIKLVEGTVAALISLLAFSLFY